MQAKIGGTPNMRMDWRKLITEDRFAADAGVKPPTTYGENESKMAPTQFQEDIFRVTSSAAFRKLQGEPQVFTFLASENVRNRLTHTIEVARVGEH